MNYKTHNSQIAVRRLVQLKVSYTGRRVDFPNFQ
jgi:hypothetical protein